ncbi:hypothetical protein RN001_008477 [Aquatica leii]|uniref:DUF4806 domain-containing protein n=1 Tax=Aquatica leii TaxID=1421715 RepID=A0AAN7PDC3_9COLE|nr:hypothetical protein RN001_008477 [Aquatica leii]
MFSLFSRFRENLHTYTYEKVYWAKTASVYARKGYLPKTSWTQYPCKSRYNNKTFATYEEALNKCQSLLIHTDSSSDVSCDDKKTELLSVRQRASTRESDFEYYDDTNIDDIPNINSPEVSIVEKTLTPESSGTSDFVASNIMVEGASELDITGLLQSQCKCSGMFKWFMGMFIRQRNTFVFKFCTSDKVVDVKEAVMVEIEQIKEGVQYNRKLIEQFIINMKREWEMIKLEIQNLNKNQFALPQNNISPLKKLLDEILPLSSVEYIIVCNELLENKENEDYFASRISAIGGKDMKSTLQNIIKSCFFVETQNMCNWSGQHKKFKLKGTKIASVVIQFVSENQKCTQTDVENCLKYIFQHTYDRLKVEKKRTEVQTGTGK